MSENVRGRREMGLGDGPLVPVKSRARDGPEKQGVLSTTCCAQYSGRKPAWKLASGENRPLVPWFTAE